MDSYKSSISAGQIIYSLLTSDSAVSTVVGTKVFPVTAQSGVALPYISYRRTSTESVPVKYGHGSETVHIEVDCFAANYKDSVALAEKVYAALDHATVDSGDLLLRSCVYENSAEGYENDAFVQSLIFRLKI